MRLAEKYIFFYALAILLSGLLLMGIGVEEIEVYYAVYLIEFLIAIELVAPFRQSLQRNLQPFIIVFLAGFLYIVVERILQILV
jgi:hypothetical protein